MAASAELYACDPDEFTERRKTLAARARAAGDAAAARTIAALRRPTRAAWMVNALVRADPTVAARLAALGDQLRAGEAALDGASIRELSKTRRRLVDDLTGRALALAGAEQPTPAVREAITATFGAALADPQVAEQVAAGRLVRAARVTGFSPGLGSTWPGPDAPGQQAALAPRPGGDDDPARVREAQRQRRAAIAEARRAVAGAERAAARTAAALAERDRQVSAIEQQLATARQGAARASEQADQAQAALAAVRHALAGLEAADATELEADATELEAADAAGLEAADAAGLEAADAAGPADTDRPAP